MKHQIAIGRRHVRQRETDPEPFRELGARPGNIDQDHVGARQLAAQESDERADDPRPDNRNAIRRSRRCVPNGVEGGLHVGGERRAPRRHAARHRDCCPGRDGENALMRMQREHDAVAKLAGAGFDPADDGITVFDREWERAAHERRAHALELAFGHFSGEHQALGAAAERAVERPHPYVMRPRLDGGLLANFAAARADVP